MKTISLANSLSVSVRIYRALLVMYPKKFREHYETQMVQVFRDLFREAYDRHGMPSVIDLWLHTFADLLVSALNERITERSQFMFSPKVILWGGVASVFCGLFWMMTGIAADGTASIVLALLLGLVGLAGLYSRQSGQGGRLALVGFALGLLGTGLELAPLWWDFASGRFSNANGDQTFSAPLVLILSLGMIILGIGIVLLGLTSLRGKTLHRWQGIPLGLGLLNILGGMAFWLVYYLPMSQGLNPWKQWYLIGGHVMYPADLVLIGLGLLLGLGWMGLGIMLTTDANAQAAQTPEASVEAQ
jgi:hypothetical protein